jgi:hypothetical protein
MPIIEKPEQVVVRMKAFLAGTSTMQPSATTTTATRPRSARR